MPGELVARGAPHMRRGVLRGPQEHIFARLQQEYVSRVLCSDEPLQDTGPLWCEALADAGCRLLRCVACRTAGVLCFAHALPAQRG
jgi:hypothetical protein